MQKIYGIISEGLYQAVVGTHKVEEKFLRKSRILHSLHRIAQKRGEEVYLVGGAIRDLLLRRTLGKDFDLVMEAEVSGLAKAVAQEIGGHVFPLDESLGTWRVILKKGKRKTELDFSSMPGRDIFEDLRQRDFTINSIAVRLEEILEKATPGLIDPLNGVSDLGQRTLRANSEESLRQDPLRMLRAFRFASTLKFSIEEETLKMIQRNKALILHSSGERIRSEFFATLGENQAGPFLRQLSETGLLGEIFPEVQGWEALNQGFQALLEHALKTVEAGEFLLRHLEGVCASFGKSLDHYFSQEVEEGISRKALFKFVAFFHDSGKPGTMTGGQKDGFPRFLDHDQEGQKINAIIARRMKLSRRALRIVSDLTRQHMRIHSLTRIQELTPRAKYRFFYDLGQEGIDLIFLAFSSSLAYETLQLHWPLPPDLPGDLLKFRKIAGELLRYYFEEFSQKSPKPLLDGKEIMEALKIPQGEAVGRLLEKLQEAEIKGKVQTKEEALKFLKNIDRFL